MTPAEHLAKAERIMAGMAKFALPQDYLALVDGSLIAGYHYGNALLHQAGILPDAEHANTPSKLGMAIAALPPAIKPAYSAFTELERLRSEFVRSPSSYDSRLDGRVRELLDVMRRASAGGAS